MTRDINIFLITIDCLRADYVNCLSNIESLTPNIDNLARNGVYFSQAIVNGPSTPFSFPSIFTSSYALTDPNFPKLSRFRTTLAKVLREHHFKTAGFNSNPYLSKYYNYDIGFDFFDDIFSEAKKQKRKQSRIKKIIKRYKKIHTLLKYVKKKVKIKYKIKPPYQRAKQINKKVLKWLDETTGKKYIWLHYMDTHHPFLPPKKFRSSNSYKMYKAEKLIKKNPRKVSKKKLLNVINQYRSTIKYIDSELGFLIKELQKRALIGNSLFIITADHGEEFREHGDFSHTSKLYEELIHVPLIINGLNIPKGINVDNIVSLIDLAPTIIELIGIDSVDDFIGKSLVPLFSNSINEYDRTGVISECLMKDGRISLSYNEGFNLISYRTKDRKLIVNEEEQIKEFYDLSEDHNEKVNLYDQRKEIVKFFDEKVENHKKLEHDFRVKFKEREKLSHITEKIVKSSLKRKLE